MRNEKDDALRNLSEMTEKAAVFERDLKSTDRALDHWKREGKNNELRLRDQQQAHRDERTELNISLHAARNELDALKKELCEINIEKQVQAMRDEYGEEGLKFKYNTRNYVVTQYVCNEEKCTSVHVSRQNPDGTLKAMNLCLHEFHAMIMNCE